MEQNSDERNNCEAGANNSNPEELSNENTAASILLVLKSMELDTETIQILEQMKRDFLGIYPNAPMAPIHMESSQAINRGTRTSHEQEKSVSLEGKNDGSLVRVIDGLKILDDQSRMKSKIFGKLPINSDAQRVSIRLKTIQIIYEGASTSQEQQKISEIINEGIREHKVERYQLVSSEDKKNWYLELKEVYIGCTIDGIEIPEFPPVEKLEGLIERCSVPFEKQLTITDVKEDQSRVSLPGDIVRQYLKPLLYPEEEKVFISHGIEVTTYDFNGNEYPMTFKFWASKFNVLTSGWKKFCRDKELIAHEDWVTVWMFRHTLTRKLCFVVLSRRFSISQLILLKIKKEKEKEEKQSRNTAKRLNIKHEN